MNRFTRLFLVGAATLLAMLVVTPKLYAFDAFDNTCDNSAEARSSTVCQEVDNGSGANLADPNNGILPKIANIIAAVGGLIAVIFIMLNGFTLMTSTGDSAKISKARDGLIYAAVGIAIIVLARVIIAVILRYL